MKVEVGGQIRVIKGSGNKAAKGAPRSKRPGANNGEARQRYWSSGRLMERKIKNLMRFNHLTRAAATDLWMSTRGTTRNRVKSVVI
jgi:hypothetical protein